MLRRFFPATQSPARATVDIYRGELGSLQQRLSQLVSESELLMQISYTKWRIDKEKERQIYEVDPDFRTGGEERVTLL